MAMGDEQMFQPIVPEAVLLLMQIGIGPEIDADAVAEHVSRPASQLLATDLSCTHARGARTKERRPCLCSRGPTKQNLHAPILSRRLNACTRGSAEFP